MNLKRMVKAPMIPTALAYAYAAGRPLLDKLHTTRERARRFNPRDILLPDGFAAEVVLGVLNAPVHCSFDDKGFCYVSESGYKIDSLPRILRVDPRSGHHEVFWELPEDEWIRTGALTGTCWHEGHLYFCYTDRLCRLDANGTYEVVVGDLPCRGDHPTGYPIVGPDGKIYVTVGSVTNAGVVGADNYAFEWLRLFPDQADVPARDVTLAGHNFEFKDVLGRVRDTVSSGAFVPFGTETTAGQVVKGQVKCTASVLRCNPDGSDLEMVAWGLRNSYGISFHPDGRLFVTEHGIDERGARYIVGDYDDFYEVIEGAWYGWPDYASGMRLDDPHWGDGGRGREPVLAEPPDPNPPKPFVTFPPHAASNGFDFCRDPGFGFEGDAFVALFGDASPVTSRRIAPVGFKVARVEMATGKVHDFAVNRVSGGAMAAGHAGFERPSHCQFGPDGSLYVVDWGQMVLAPEEGGVRMTRGTGALWRIRRVPGPLGQAPPEPIELPLNLLRPLRAMSPR